MNNAGPVKNRLIGDWQLNTSYVYLSGAPMVMPDAIPVRDPSLPAGQQGPTRYFDTCTLLTNGTRSHCIGDEPITWQQLAPNQLRTYSIYSPNIRNPWIPRLNVSLFKDIPIRERLRMQFRASAFNALNAKIYPIPDVNITDANFGQANPLGNQANGSRVGELALRLLW